MIELVCLDYDRRLGAYCITARATYRWFLAAVAGAERNLEIQRKIIKGAKAYATLRADLKRGCVLPPLVLAIKNLEVPAALNAAPGEELDRGEVLEALREPINGVDPMNVYIIDGLQRTNAIKQTFDELQGAAKDAFLGNQLRFELWLNISFSALAYRMLLMNAGQRPMSMKHQVEILSRKLHEELATIPDIEILSSLEARRRTRAGQFHLAKLAQAFQAWLQGQPNLDLRNLVMEQLLAEAALETLGASLSGARPDEERDAFRQLVQWMVQMDRALPPEQAEFFGQETVLQGIAAAVGSAQKSADIKPRMDACLARLLDSTRRAPDQDPAGIRDFEELRKGIDPSKANVGEATRDMVYYAFQEHFIANGDKGMQDCWRFAAGRV